MLVYAIMLRISLAGPFLEVRHKTINIYCLITVLKRFKKNATVFRCDIVDGLPKVYRLELIFLPEFKQELSETKGCA